MNGFVANAAVIVSIYSTDAREGGRVPFTPPPPSPRMSGRCLQHQSTTASSSGPEFTTLLLHFIPGQLDVVYVLTTDEATCSDSAVNQRFAAHRPFVAPLCAITSPLLVMISMA